MERYKRKFSEVINIKAYMIDKVIWLAWGKGSGTTISNSLISRNQFETFSDHPKMNKHSDTIADWNTWARKQKPVKKTAEGGMYIMPYYYNDFAMDDWKIWGGAVKADKKIYVVIKHQGQYTYVTPFFDKAEALSWLMN